MTKPLWMQIREAFERKGYFHPSPELRDELVGIAIDYADQKTAAARAEIERLTKERDSFRAVLEGAKYGNIGAIANQSAEVSFMLGSIVATKTKRLITERDEALAQVAAAYEAASKAQPTYTLKDPDDAYGVNDVVYVSQLAIRALTPTHAKAALEAYGREKVREGMKRAVELYPQGIAAILAEMEKEGGE